MGVGIRPADEVGMGVVQECLCGFLGGDCEGGGVGGVLEGVELRGGVSDGCGKVEEGGKGDLGCLRMRYGVFLRG